MHALLAVIFTDKPDNVPGAVAEALARYQVAEGQYPDPAQPLEMSSWEFGGNWSHLLGGNEGSARDLSRALRVDGHYAPFRLLFPADLGHDDVIIEGGDRDTWAAILHKLDAYHEDSWAVVVDIHYA